MSNYEDYVSLDDPEDQPKPYYKTWKFILLSIIVTPVLLYIFIIGPVLAIPPKIPVPVLSKHNSVEYELHPIQGITENHIKSHKQRFVFIGDVHGCYEELQKLLNKAKYNRKHDQVILLGDFISKGPHSLKVLEYAIKENFTTVLGNHELNVLSKYSNFEPLIFDDDDVFHNQEEPDYSRMDEELLIARKLTPDQVRFLAASPLVLDLGLIPLFPTNPSPNEPSSTYTDYRLLRGLATHIGILPPYRNALNQNVTEWLDIPKYWYQDYNKAMNKEFSKNDRTIVFYGHHSSMGLNLRKYSKGLDSGCVKGNALSALIISAEMAKDGEISYSQQVVQVDCS